MFENETKHPDYTVSFEVLWSGCMQFVKFILAGNQCSNFKTSIVKKNKKTFDYWLIIGSCLDHHWCSSHYTVSHVRNKNFNIQGRSPNVVKYFPYHKELLLKERIRSLWEQILSFKRSSNFEKGRNGRKSLFDPVVSLSCA